MVSLERELRELCCLQQALDNPLFDEEHDWLRSAYIVRVHELVHVHRAYERAMPYREWYEARYGDL